jgi:glucokinase
MSRTPATSAPALLADVGGTHARFALRLANGTIGQTVDLRSAEFSDLSSATTEGLSLLWKTLPSSLSSSGSVLEAAVAVAGPIIGDRVELTNVGWSFSIEETRRALGLDRLVVVNDLAALAWAVPTFAANDARSGKAFIEGKDERPGPGESITAVIAVGTGLGAATHVRGDGFEIVLPSEGGHGDLAASNQHEWNVVERLSARFGGHVSVERAVSGGGLSNLWTALAELDGERSGAELEPAEVTRRAVAAEPRALEAMALFSGWLGAFAGDFALAVGARGGVWLGGGVLAALGAAFDRASFDRRFRAKGRFEAWLAGVPVRDVDDPLAAFRGLSRRLAVGD